MLLPEDDPDLRRALGRAAGANVPAFPDLDAGNIACSWCSIWPVRVAIGPMSPGVAWPMADLSRGATADDIVEVAAMAALQCE